MFNPVPRFFVFRGDDAEAQVNRWLTENEGKIYRQGPSGEFLMSFTLGTDVQGHLIIAAMAQMNESYH